MRESVRNLTSAAVVLLLAGSVQAAELPLGEGQSGSAALPEKRSYTVKVGAGYVGMSGCNCDNFGLVNSGGESNVGPGNNIHGLSENPLVQWNVGVTILPDTLNLSFGIGGTRSSNKIESHGSGIIRHGESEQQDDYYSVFVRPSFAVTPVGGFGLGVERLASQKGLVGSDGGAPSHPVNVVDMPNDGRNPGGFGGATSMILPREDSLGFDTDFTRYKLSYHFPVWDSLGIEVAREKGNRQFYRYGVELVPGTTSSTAFVSRGSYTGNRIAGGWMPDTGKLGSGFSISMLQIFQTKIKANYYDYQFGRQEEMGGVHFEGFTVGFNYRWKMSSYLIDASFFAEKQRESYPDRLGVAGYSCSGCGAGEIKRTGSYTAGALSVTF